MSCHLILTVDYEIFGNGQGCLKHCIIEPAQSLLRVADQFQAPVTFFAEAVELMAMERELGRSAVVEIRHQLASAVLAGHDVQLHLHPQWQNAKRRKDGQWELDFRRWRIGDLPPDEVDQLIAAGKAWIDDVAFPNASGRECIAFRAGSWCIQPSESVVRSLRSQGFAVESTVVPGTRRFGSAEWSDFRCAPELPFWCIDSDVCRPTASGIWEVPIASARLARFEQIFAELQARNTRNSRFALNCQGSYAMGASGPLDSFSTTICKLLELGVGKLDFSTMPADTLVKITLDWITRFAATNESTPVVAIAHTKNWTESSGAHLKKYLSWARDSGLRFSTYSQWIETLATGCAVEVSGASNAPNPLCAK